MKISLASDHAGYLYKEEIKKHLLAEGHEVLDCGTDSTESCDYPIFAKAAAEKIVKKEAECGVIVCSSGQGVMMAANKVKGIRAGLAFNDDTARLMKEHNNANMISFAANFSSIEDVKRQVDIFLNAKFLGGRHERRVNEIE